MEFSKEHQLWLLKFLVSTSRNESYTSYTQFVLLWGFFFKWHPKPSGDIPGMVSELLVPDFRVVLQPPVETNTHQWRAVIWMTSCILSLLREVSVTPRLWHCQWCTQGLAFHWSCLFQAGTKCLTRAESFVSPEPSLQAPAHPAQLLEKARSATLKMRSLP